jgi:hypothetical protein
MVFILLSLAYLYKAVSTSRVPYNTIQSPVILYNSYIHGKIPFEITGPV